MAIAIFLQGCTWPEPYDTNSPCAAIDADGTSWYYAWKHLQDGLGMAQLGDQIYVAEGIYRPDENSGAPNGTNIRTTYFVMLDAVAIYGGFPSGGGDWPQRDPNAYPTILSGDLAEDDGYINSAQDVADDPNRIENSYHVVHASTADLYSILDGFTISGGNAWGGLLNAESKGGGIYNNGGQPTIRNCVIRENKTRSIGGGVYNYGSSSTPLIIDCTFTVNYSDADGGGLYNQNGIPTLDNCIFSNNMAVGKGGAVSSYGGGNWSLTDCTFTLNAAPNGGGIRNENASPQLENCTFTANTATSGGAFYNYGSSSQPVFTECDLTSNSAANGGVMRNYYGMVTFEDCLFTDNSANTGGVVQSGSGSASVKAVRCEFISNRAIAGSGGVFYGGASTAIDSIFYDNSAYISGGAIRTTQNGDYVNCAFYGNTAEDDGGAIFATGTSTLVNCLFSANRANSVGGGIFVDQSTTPILTNCTLGHNYAAAGAGIFHNSGSVLTLTNCVLWDNQDDGGLDESAQIYMNYGSTDITYSCIMDRDPDDGSIPFGGAVNYNIDDDPLFADPSGLDTIIGTQDDNLRLSATSPCVDTGNRFAPPPDIYDIDGDDDFAEMTPDLDKHNRIADVGCSDDEKVDMGAYELVVIYIGDFDNSCHVDLLDFFIFAQTWLATDGQQPYYNPICDISIPADNTIDINDLYVFVGNWLTNAGL